MSDEPTAVRRALNATVGHPQRSRFLEDVAFAIGVLLGAGYVSLVEIIPRICFALAKCQNAPTAMAIPWGLIAVLALLVAPKMLGRATAGKVWDKLAGKGG